MKKKKNPLRILIPLNIGLFCGVFFSILWEGLPIYLPLALLVLLLISVFLLVKNIEKQIHQYMESKEVPPLDLPLAETLEDEVSLKLAKANYILQKRILELLEANMITRDSISSLGEDILQTIKASIKYDRGNTKQIIEAVSKQTPSKEQDMKPDLTPILSALTEITAEIKSEKDALQELARKIEELAGRPVTIHTEALPTISKPSVEVPSEFILESEAEPEPTPELKPVSEPTPIPAPVEEEPFDPNKPMSPEDIAATKTNETESTPELKPVSEPTPIPAPIEEEPFDPNKPMSPEDIAALIASLGE